MRGADNLVLIGRAEQVDTAHGLASSYACQNCCPDSFVGALASDCGIPTFPLDTAELAGTERDQDCYGGIYEYRVNEVVAVAWWSFAPEVATVDEGGVATGQSAGTAGIRASWYASTWYFDLVHGMCRASVTNAVANAACNVLTPPANRGRIQAQGSNPPVQVSRAWAQQDPPSKARGLDLLDEVWDSLTPSQQRDRQQAYYDARQFINNAPQDGYPPMSRHFYDPQRRDPNARIDIEIITGQAFVGPY